MVLFKVPVVRRTSVSNRKEQNNPRDCNHNAKSTENHPGFGFAGRTSGNCLVAP